MKDNELIKFIIDADKEYGKKLPSEEIALVFDFGASDSTVLRRASTIRAWVDYIESLEYSNNNELKEVDNYSEFENYALNSRLNFSYKLVFLVSYLKTYEKNGNVWVGIDDLETIYTEYYSARMRKGMKVEKEGTAYNIQTLSQKSFMVKNIIDNPMNAYMNAGYIDFDRKSNNIRLIGSLAQQSIENELITKIYTKLEEYYKENNLDEIVEEAAKNNNFVPVLHSNNYRRIVFKNKNIYYLALANWQDTKYNLVDYKFDIKEYIKSANYLEFTSSDADEHGELINRVIKDISEQKEYLEDAKKEYFKKHSD